MGLSYLLNLACALVSYLLPRGHLLWSSQNPFWLPFAKLATLEETRIAFPPGLLFVSNKRGLALVGNT
jgi:hypothetical protein